jgi:hypothetical protein
MRQLCQAADDNAYYFSQKSNLRQQAFSCLRSGRAYRLLSGNAGAGAAAPKKKAGAKGGSE